jgi:glyoxylate/hydroxypyruvate reductase A
LPRAVPIVRLVDPYLIAAMGEYDVLQVTRLHRQDFEYRAQQHAGVWRELPQRNAGERPVGILGFGAIGRDAAQKLAGLGFPVFGWTRRPQQIAGFPTYAGTAGLPAYSRDRKSSSASCR